MGMESNGQEENQTAELLDRLRKEHRYYAQQLESLSSAPYLSEEAKLEETRLKKLKLRIKDQMSRLPAPANGAPAASRQTV